MPGRRGPKILQVVPYVDEFNGVITHTKAIDNIVKGDVYSGSNEYWFKGFNNFISDASKLDEYDIVHFHDCWDEDLAQLGDKKMVTFHCREMAEKIGPVSDDDICISDEVLDRLKLGRVVGQPITTKDFPLVPLGKGTVTLNWNAAGSARVGSILKDKLKDSIVNIIKDAEKIVAVGRAALEAALMGRPVFIIGSEYADKQLTVNNYDLLKTHNFSGRTLKREVTNDIVSEILSMKVDKKLRNKIIEENDSLKIVKELYGTNKF